MVYGPLRWTSPGMRCVAHYRLRAPQRFVHRRLKIKHKMSTYFKELQYVGTIDATYTSQFVDITGFSGVRVMAYSNAAYDFHIDWSIDSGANFDYTDSLSAVTGTHRMTIPVRARYMRWRAASSVPPQTFRLSIATYI